MRVFKNITTRSFFIPFATPKGPEDVWFKAKTEVMVPDSFTSKILDKYILKRMVRKIADSPSQVTSKKKSK